MVRSIHRSGALCPDSITVPPVLSPPFSRHTVPSGWTQSAIVSDDHIYGKIKSDRRCGTEWDPYWRTIVSVVTEKIKFFLPIIYVECLRRPFFRGGLSAREYVFNVAERNGAGLQDQACGVVATWSVADCASGKTASAEIMVTLGISVVTRRVSANEELAALLPSIASIGWFAHFYTSIVTVS